MREGSKRTPMELLRAAIKEQKCEMPCDTLHELHGDQGSYCTGRRCDECKIDALRKAADLVEAELDALKARALPEGMEWLLEVWPRWSNGEYCKFGDWWTAAKYGEHEPKQLRRLVFYTPEQLKEWEQDEGDNFGYEWDFMRPSDTTYRPDKAEPPAPKVLDADGVEIRVGDKLYDTETGCGRTVRAINSNGTVEFEGYEDRGWFTWFLAHRAPVLASDGEPIEVGQTVFKLTDDRPYTVKSIDGDHVYINAGGSALDIWTFPHKLTHQRPVLDADGAPIKVGDTVYVAPFDDPLTVRGFAADGRVLMDCHSDDSFGYRPERLTHTKPEIDTWERIEEDAKLWPGEYAQGHPGWAEHDGRLSEFMALDLVRRCRALAERERGE